MPIVKVPVNPKFGIVSLSRAELLLAQNQQKAGRTPRTAKSLPATEISPAFISKYNCTAECDRERLDAVVKRALLHAKYKAGLHHPGHGSTSSSSSSSSSSPTHGGLADTITDFSSAWLELILLCQCYGPHQEEVLMTLATSLNHAPLSLAHIPSLLYIAGLCYQWLKSDVISGNVLRSGELLLLKLLYLASLRVFHHHLTGALHDAFTREQVRQLKFDLEGFENRERVYRNFPEALLHWKVALEVGLLVCEQYSRPLHDPTTSALSRPTSKEEGVGVEGETGTSTWDERGASSSKMGLSSHGGHSLPAVLWHALDVWQCARQGYESLQEAMEDFRTCSTTFHTQNWMEGMLAMDILCTASQANINVLNLVHSLASGCGGAPYIQEDQLSHDTRSQPPKLRGPCVKLEGDLILGDEQHSTFHTSPMSTLTGTRFKLPTSVKHSSPQSKMESVKGSPRSSPKRLITLNILGMQPEFLDPYLESGVTVEQTVTYTTFAETATPAETASEVSAGTKGQVDYNMLAGHSSGSLGSSVGTQSLIENESIPDIVPSGTSSNTSVDLGSMSSIDVGLSKSVGIFSELKISKNLDASAISDERSKGESDGPVGNTGEKKVSLTDSVSLLGTRLSAECTGTSADEKKESPAGESFDRVGLLDDRFQYLQLNRAHGQQEGRHVAGGKTVTVSLPVRNIDTRCTHYTHSTAALSGGAGILGSQVPPSTLYRHSVFSVPQTPDTENEESVTFGGRTVSKFESWPSEVALAYVLNMAAVVIYGRTSRIQKVALEGGNTRERSRGDVKKWGLLQLSEFESEDTVSKYDISSCSWSVRHGAVLGLSRVCRTCQHQPMKDGMSNVAWSKLMQRRLVEKDSRVLEAYKLSQACPDLDRLLLSVDLQPPFSSPLMAHMADNLAQLFLSPVTPTPAETKPPSSTIRSPMNTTPQKSKGSSKVARKVQARVDTHLGPRVIPPPDFTTRTTAALNKIAEEHWRRQMTKEEKERAKEDKHTAT